MEDNKPSSTAASVGAIRFAQTKDLRLPSVGPDKEVWNFLPLKYRIQGGALWRVARWFLQKNLPGMYEWIYCRTMYYDNLVKQAISSGSKQIVIAGAGYDTRATRFKNLAKQHKVTFFELDFPSTQNNKISLLNTTNETHINYVPIDFTSQSISDVLKISSFDPKLPSLFYFEGVTMYLSESELKDTLSDIKSYMETPSSVAFDFCNPETITGKDKSYGALETYKHVKKVGEPLRWGYNPRLISDFLKPLGYITKEILSPPQIEKKFLTSSQGEVTARVTAFNHLVKAEF